MDSAAREGIPGPGQEEPAAEPGGLRMLLGAQPRRLREAAGISAEKAGYEIRASRSKISRMETGRPGHQTAPDEEIERRVGLRPGQQDLLAGPQPPRVWAVMDEAVADQLSGEALPPAGTIRFIGQVARKA